MAVTNHEMVSTKIMQLQYETCVLTVSHGQCS